MRKSTVVHAAGTGKFATLLQELIVAYGGTKADLARAVGVRASTISHLLGETGTPSTELCLRLADVTEVSPSRVLRAAGKGDLAKLIERLYGPAANRAFLRGIARAKRVPPRDRAALQLLNAVPRRTRNAVLILLDATLATLSEKTRRYDEIRLIRRRAS